MPVRDVKIGLIGCGRLAQFVHLRILTRLPGARTVALADPDEGRLANARAMVPDAEVFHDYRELLRSDSVDAVVICLPTGMHAEAAQAAFAAGKHVYLEKPIATDLAGADAVIAACRATGRVGQIGFNYRYHPAFVEARRRIASGELGRLVAVRSSFCAAARDLPRWKRTRASGGGALLDLASHHADILRYILSLEIHDVSASIRSVRSEADTASLEMRFADGLIAQTLVSSSAVEDDTVEVIGDRGTLCINRHDGAVKYFPPKRGNGLPQRVQRIASLLTEAAGQCGRLLTSSLDPSYEPALRDFVDCATTGRAPRATLDDARRSLAVMLAAEESAGTRRRVAVQGAPPLVESALAPLPRFDLPQINAQLTDPARPAMSVVLVSTGGFQVLRPVVQHFARQTIAHRLQLVLVGADQKAFADYSEQESRGLFGVKFVFIGPIENVDLAAAPGVKAADAPIVALMEDHAFVEPDWAQVMLDAHISGNWTAVGSTIINANPRTVLSWANHLLSYGEWNEPARRGETTSVSRHNVTFKRDALLDYGEHLGRRLTRDGGLFADLVSRGHEFLLEPRGRIHHVNPSRLASTLQLRIGAGRLTAAARARKENWSLLQRALYSFGSPLIPAVRFVRLRRDLFIHGKKLVPQPKATEALIIGTILDGFGQMLGFALGPGRVGDKLAAFEWERKRHLVRSDLPCLQGIVAPETARTERRDPAAQLPATV